MKPFIYALVDPIEPQHLRYIGMTTVRPGRPYEHLKEARRLAAKSTHVVHWVRNLLSEGRTYQVVVLEEFDTNTDITSVRQAEIDFIAAARQEGHKLTNLTDGGDGVCGYVWTEENRQNQSRAIKAYYEKHPEAGRTTAERNHEKFKDPAERKKVGDRFRGIVPSAETKEKVKAGLRKHFADPTVREMCRRAVLGIKRSDATKEKLRILALGNQRGAGRKKSEEEKIRTGAKIKETYARKKALEPEVVAATNRQIAETLRGRKASEDKRASHRAAHARGAYKNSKRTSPINGPDVTPAERLARRIARAERQLAKLTVELANE